MRPQTIGFGFVGIMCLGAILAACAPDPISVKKSENPMVDQVSDLGMVDGCSIKWVSMVNRYGFYLVRCKGLSTTTAQYTSGGKGSHTVPTIQIEEDQ